MSYRVTWENQITKRVARSFSRGFVSKEAGEAFVERMKPKKYIKEISMYETSEDFDALRERSRWRQKQGIILLPIK